VFEIKSLRLYEFATVCKSLGIGFMA